MRQPQARAVIVFDVSRLITRAGQATPTGIDRVELAYARHLIARHDAGMFCPRRPAGAVWRCCRSRWSSAMSRRSPRYGAKGRSVRRRGSGRVGSAASAARQLGPPPARVPRAGMQAAADTPVYLLVSHHHLENRRLIARLKRRHGMSFVCLIHDLIPIEFPEYARPGQDAAASPPHRDRRGAGRCVIVAIDSDRRRPATLYRARRRAPARADGAVRGRAAAARRRPGRRSPERPYFVCLGTIEARKNHLLLLNLWRDLAAQAGSEAPALVLIGRRGWEVENTIDMLDRCPALRGIVSERSASIRQRNRSPGKKCAGPAAAVLCRRLRFPAGRSIGARRPGAGQRHPGVSRDRRRCRRNIFDPLDGAGWRRAILDYAATPSPRREAQLQRSGRLAAAALGRTFRGGRWR